jgi:two-component system sensor histidine kinase/response regulator
LIYRFNFENDLKNDLKSLGENNIFFLFNSQPISIKIKLMPQSMKRPITYSRFLLSCSFVLFCHQFTLYSQTTLTDSLVKELSTKKTLKDKVDVLGKLSIAFSSVDPSKKFYYAKQTLLLAQENSIDSLIPIAYMDMGMAYGIQTRYDSAMYYFNKGLQISLSKNYEKDIARAYMNIGFVYDRLDNPKKSIDYYKSALKLYKKLNITKGICQTYTNLGSLYFDLNEFKIADEYFKQVLKKYEEAADEAGISYGYFILGNSNRMLNNDAIAYEYYTKSIAIRTKLQNLSGIAVSSWGLGELYRKQGKYLEAQSLYEAALTINRSLKDKYNEVAVLISLANNYFELKNFKKAKEVATEAFAVSKIASSMNLETVSLEVLIQVEKQTNNYKKAFALSELRQTILDSMQIERSKNELVYSDFQRISSENSSLEKSNEVISTKNLTYKIAIYIITSLLLIVVILLILYLIKIRQKNKINLILETQKQEITTINHELESVNEELLVQNDLINTQKDELERINAVKNKFFSIVSHDLRSPIATLKMLFNSYFSGHLTQEEMNVLLKKLEENIFNTADFLDNLLEWSKSQLEGMVVKPETFAIKTLVERNLKILNAQITEKKLIIGTDMDEAIQVWADRNMMNVVFRNIISNSIKFCKPGNSIFIKATVAADKVLIAVQDTGIGIAIDEQKKIFHLEHTISQGTSGEKGHHIGLVLCKDMLEQNHGRIWCESEVNKGTTFFIEIPLKER